MGLEGFGSVAAVDDDDDSGTLVMDSSESLLVTALEFIPAGENVSRESAGLIGRAGQMWLLF